MVRPSFSMVLAAAPLLLAGCNQNGGLTYQQAYDQKQYQQAFDKAAPIGINERAPDRQRAALVAGLSAQAMKNYEEAKKWLVPLRYSTDKDIAARARAAVGLIAQAEGKNAEAARELSSAGDQMEGDEAARAKLSAGDEYKKLGLEKDARREYQEASTEADDPAIKAAADQKAKAPTYFVQCGAYSTRQGAERQVKAIKAQVTKAGQPSPTILQTNPNGTPLFVVQVGPYADKNQAIAAKAKMNMATAAVMTRQ